MFRALELSTEGKHLPGIVDALEGLGGCCLENCQYRCVGCCCYLTSEPLYDLREGRRTKELLAKNSRQPVAEAAAFVAKVLTFQVS